MKALSAVFKFLLVVAVLAVLAKLFLFDIVRTDSYSMVPTLFAGDTFLVAKRVSLGLGDIAVCRNPEDPSRMVVLRVLAVPGSSFHMKRNHVYVQGEKKHLDDLRSEIYVDDTSGEGLQYLVTTATEMVGGSLHRIAMMDRGRDKSFRKVNVSQGLFLVGDNRNMSWDSRHFGEVMITECIGEAFLVVWPGEDSGDFSRMSRLMSWLD